METKNYRPLKEGYTGTVLDGYTGSGNTTSHAPATITNVQSGVVRPTEIKTSTSHTDQDKTNKKV
jgi:hypothetical protein